MTQYCAVTLNTLKIEIIYYLTNSLYIRILKYIIVKKQRQYLSFTQSH